MNKCSFIIAITGTVLMFASCSNKRFLIAPEFTNIEKVSKIETGMSVEKVNSTLDIVPFDAYNLDQANLTLVYNYRLKERRVPVTNYGQYVQLYDDAVNKSIHSEAAQREAGTVFYTEWKKLYVHFQDRKCTGYITDSGIKRTKDDPNANYLALLNGSIRILRENPKTILLNDGVHGEDEIVIPLDENGNFVFYPQGEKDSNNSYFWLGLGNKISNIFRKNKKHKYPFK